MPDMVNDKVKVAVLGSTGYSAGELIKILLRHPHVELTALTTRQDGNPPVSKIHPALYGRCDLNCENLSTEEVIDRADLVFCALPHGASMAVIPDILAGGCKVVDLSADYRLNGPGVYETWYGLVHTDPTRLENTVYGLPELFAEDIKGKDLIANPGCYTSTSILGLAPLLCEGYIDPKNICIDAKSGVSGAGKNLKQTYLYAECNESISPYAVGTHRHTPEIDMVLSQASKKNVEVLFTPHLTPMDRGILASIYARPTKKATEEELLEVVRNFYKDCPFIRVVEDLPATKQTVDTNFCDITVRVARGYVIIFSCLDNLIKGASGVAVQNFNLLYDYPETTALIV